MTTRFALALGLGACSLGLGASSSSAMPLSGLAISAVNPIVLEAIIDMVHSDWGYGNGAYGHDVDSQDDHGAQVDFGYRR
jgi:hypothetical protein